MEQATGGISIEAESAGPILPRTRLIEGLNSARSARVILLEAPAGYSKSTTLRLWSSSDPRPFVWVNCESRYNDPAMLTDVVISAFAESEATETNLPPGVGGPGPDLSLVLQRLGEAVGDLGPFVLAVDDAHLLETDESWHVLYTLIAALPKGSQVAIATRTRPGLPLGRLRARGELQEFLAPDLAMTRNESRELLAGLDPDLGSQADEIHEKAEGWPAAMYLAGLSRRRGGQGAIDAQAFDGSDRVVVDYFRDEFFQGMPEEKARFLYETSVLTELDGPLCDSVTGRSDSAVLLEELSSENALIVPLDRQGIRYRYHHLFADMLKSELRLRSPDSEAGLHHRAAACLAARNEIPGAIDHAISSGDFDFAGAMIWLYFPELSGRGRIATLERWFETIGFDQVEQVPALVLTRAHEMIASGQGDQAFYWLSVAERVITEDSPTYPDLLMLRATFGPDGPAQMIEDSSRAAELLDPGNPWQVPVKLYQGIGLFLEEDSGSEEMFRRAAREAVNVSPVIQTMALAHLALAELERDRVNEAFTHIMRAHDQVERCGLSTLGAMSLVYAVLAKVLVRQGRIEDSMRTLTQATKLSEGMEDFIGWYEAELILTCCRTMIRTGQFESAAALVGRAEEVVSRMKDSPRLVRWLDEVKSNIEQPRNSLAEQLNLTKAELRTLQFLPSHHSFRSMGEQLFLSQNTVKTQASSLYRKLGVNSRAEAVMEGRRLGLLDREEG